MRLTLPNKTGPFLNKLIMYLLVGYTFFMLGRSIWANYELKKQTEIVKEDLAKVEKENKNLENLIIYYQSSSFREVEARRKLGLKKPGEKVVNIPIKGASDYQAETKQQQQNISETKLNETPANWQLWWHYFF